MGEPGDRELIARVKGGDDAAFELLMDRYLDRVVGLARRALGDAHEAMDVAQEVFVGAYKALATWKEEGQLFSWLYRTTYNLCSHRLRKRTALPVPDFPETPARDVSSDEARRSELAQALSKAVDGLPERQRQVFMLRHEEELPLSEVAGRLGISVGAAKSHLHRALSEIRDALRRRKFL